MLGVLSHRIIFSVSSEKLISEVCLIVLTLIHLSSVFRLLREDCRIKVICCVKQSAVVVARDCTDVQCK